MQIHELTKRNLAEASVADRIKSAASAVKTGIQNIPNKIAASNVAHATAQQQKTQAQAAKYADILRSRGYTGQTAPAGALAPGQRIQVIYTPPGQPNGPKSNYYKTSAGWENELGQPITNPNSVAYLEQLYKAQVRPAAASAVQSTTAPAVQTGAAPAVMTSGDFTSALSQLNLNTTQLGALKQRLFQDPAFANAFLKTLGLKK